MPRSRSANSRFVILKLLFRAQGSYTMATHQIVFLIVVTFFAIQGFRKGAAQFVFSIISLAIAYVATIVLIEPVADWLKGFTEIRGLAALAVSGCLVFLASSSISNLLITLLLKWAGVSTHSPRMNQRIGGALIASAVGSVIGLIAVWMLAFIPSKPFSSLLTEDFDNNVAPLADPQSKDTLQKLANHLVGFGAKQMLSMASDSNELNDLSVQLIENPQVTMDHIEKMTQSNEFKSLFNNISNQKVFDSLEPEQIAMMPEFQQLIRQPNYQQLTQDRFKNDNTPLRHAEAFADIWAKARFVQFDPEIQSIFSSAAIREQIQQGRFIQLLNDDRLLQLFERVASADAEAFKQQLRQGHINIQYQEVRSNSAEHLKTPSTSQSFNASEPVLIYKWVDEKGKVHYSDKPQYEGQKPIKPN